MGLSETIWKLPQVRWVVALFIALCPYVGRAAAQHPRYVLIDEAGSGPGGSAQQAMLILLQAPRVQVLGITIVAGDVAEDVGVRHTLRMLELTGHTDVPVIAGAQVPLVRDREQTFLDQKRYGKTGYMGTWQGPDVEAGVPRQMPEGEPTTTAMLNEDAAHFMIYMVHLHPHEVTIFCGGPLTNVALAIRLDPQFAVFAKELVVMGGALSPKSDDPEYSMNPRHEFNFWFDPEAAHIVLTAPWARVTDTPADATVQVRTPDAGTALKDSRIAGTLSGRYFLQYPSDAPYMWNELAALAWFEPDVIRTSVTLYMDVNLDHGYSYGDTITWSKAEKPLAGVRPIVIQTEVDVPRFEKLLRSLIPPA